MSEERLNIPTVHFADGSAYLENITKYERLKDMKVLGDSSLYENIGYVNEIQLTIEYDHLVFKLLDILGFHKDNYMDAIDKSEFKDMYYGVYDNLPITADWFAMSEGYVYNKNYKEDETPLFVAWKNPRVSTNGGKIQLPPNVHNLTSKVRLNVAIYVIDFDETKCNVNKGYHLLKPIKIHGNRYKVRISTVSTYANNNADNIHYSYVMKILAYCMENSIPMLTNKFVDEDMIYHGE